MKSLRYKIKYNINKSLVRLSVNSKMSDSEGETSEENPDLENRAMEAIRKFFAQKFSLGSDDESTQETKVISDLTFDGLMKHWKEKGFKNIITMVGAGISTSAGIPDFRSPGSGLYDNLQKYDLPHPSAIFELSYFSSNPKPFFALAKELYPGTFNPTPSHYFVRLLHEKGLLLRHYTQNIDTLERIAGIPDEKLVEAHGTFYTNHCVDCRKSFSMEWMKEQIFADVIPTCDECKSVVKPDIVFFGENLPENFYTLPLKDFKECDLLIIMGTSLEVQPFASLIDKAGKECIRLLVNRSKVGGNSLMSSWFMSGPGFMYDNVKNTRDIAYIGDCDDGVLAIADALGWGEELGQLMESEHERLKEETKKAKEEKSSNSKNKEEKETKEETKKAKEEKSSNSKNIEEKEEKIAKRSE